MYTRKINDLTKIEISKLDRNRSIARRIMERGILVGSDWPDEFGGKVARLASVITPNGLIFAIQNYVGGYI